MTDEPWVLAIDFGTSFTVAASRIGDRAPEVIEIDGERRLPSIVMVDESGAVLVGRAAESLAGSSPGRVLRAPKSRLGEPAPVVLGGRPHPITGLVADLLRHVYREAVRYHGREPEQVRLTHPATWSGPRRQQLVAAAELAGIAEPVLVPEPVAAAIAYADDGGVPSDGHVLVYDLGGGTFDTAALQATPDGFVVIGRPGGDPRLGGELFDELLANTIGERLDDDVFEQIQLAEDSLWQQAAVGLLRESRRVKEALSSHPFADVLLGLPTGLVQQRIDQRDLYRVIGPYIDESVDVMRQTAVGAGLDGTSLSSIYLVGGASRTPLVEESVSAAFPDVLISRRGDPKGVVALGATHPKATPTSLAQRSSLDRATTLERPGPPPAPIVVTDPVDTAVVPPAPGATTIDLPDPTVVERSAPTVIERASDLDAAPVTAALPAVTPTGRRFDPRVLIGAGIAAVLLLVVGVAIAMGRGDADEAAPRVTDATIAPVGGLVTLPPTGATTSPTVTTPVTTPVTSPPTQAPSTTTTAPTTVAPTPTSPVDVPTKTAPPPSAGAPTRADLEAALVQLADLTNATWTELAYEAGTPFCGTTPEAGLVDTVGRQFQAAAGGVIVIGSVVSTYATPADAATEFTASTDSISNCPNSTYMIEGITYDMQVNVQPITAELVPLPCNDQGALVTIALTNADSPIPFLGQYVAGIRCGVNITTVALGTDQLTTDLPPDFIKAISVSAIRIDQLPGSG